MHTGYICTYCVSDRESCMCTGIIIPGRRTPRPVRARCQRIPAALARCWTWVRIRAAHPRAQLVSVYGSHTDRTGRGMCMRIHPPPFCKVHAMHTCVSHSAGVCVSEDAPPAPPPYAATVTASTSPPTPIQPRRKPARATLRVGTKRVQNGYKTACLMIDTYHYIHVKIYVAILSQ
jgi:hypothetical protein